MNGEFGNISFKKLLALLSTGVTLLTMPACTMKKETKEDIIDNIGVEYQIESETLNVVEKTNIKDFYMNEEELFDNYGNRIAKEDAIYDINDNLVQIVYHTGLISESWYKQFEYNEEGSLVDISFYDMDDNLIEVDKENNFIYLDGKISEVKLINEDGKILDSTKILYQDDKLIGVSSNYNNPFNYKEHNFNKEFVYKENGELNKIISYVNDEMSSYIDKASTYGEDGQTIMSMYINNNSQKFKEIRYNNGVIQEILTTQYPNVFDGLKEPLTTIQTKYNEQGVRTEQITKVYSGDNTVIEHDINEYDENDNCIKSTWFGADDEVIYSVEYDYNDKNQVSNERYVSADKKKETTYDYDEKGRNIFEVVKNYDNETKNSITTTSYKYDEEDRVLESKKITKDSNGDISFYSYQVKTYEIIDGILNKKTVEYDMDGNKKSEGISTIGDSSESFKDTIYDFEGNIRSIREINLTYSDNGLITSKQDKHQGDGYYINNVTVYTYEEGYIQTNITTYEYDINDNIINTRVDNYNKYHERISSLVYDADNNLISEINYDQSGNAITSEETNELTFTLK